MLTVQNMVFMFGFGWLTLPHIQGIFIFIIKYICLFIYIYIFIIYLYMDMIIKNYAFWSEYGLSDIKSHEMRPDKLETGLLYFG